MPIPLPGFRRATYASPGELDGKPTCPSCGWHTIEVMDTGIPAGTSSEGNSLESAGWRCTHCKMTGVRSKA